MKLQSHIKSFQKRLIGHYDLEYFACRYQHATIQAFCPVLQPSQIRPAILGEAPASGPYRGRNKQEQGRVLPRSQAQIQRHLRHLPNFSEWGCQYPVSHVCHGSSLLSLHHQVAGKFDAQFINQLPPSCKYICHNGAGLSHYHQGFPPLKNP